MSHLAAGWAWQQPCTGTRKLVLLALADHAHDDGRCWPGVQGLAIKCGLGERTMRAALGDLVALGLIQSEARYRDDGSQSSNNYALNMEGWVPNLHRGGANAAPPGAKSAPAPLQNLHPSESVSPETVIEPVIEPGDKSEIPQNAESQENSELWPKWYSLGMGVPGWKASFEMAEAWRVETNIPEELAEVTVYGLRDWWSRLPKDGKRRQAGDPYQTWQNWCRRDRDGWAARNQGSHAPPVKNNFGAEGMSQEENLAALKRYDTELSERRAKHDDEQRARAAAERE